MMRRPQNWMMDLMMMEENLINELLDYCTDAFELDYKTDVQKVFDMYHDKATLIGNIDPSGVLALGTVDMVRQKTRELLETYKTSNRFILNAGCAIPPNTPDENLFAMIDEAREFFR